MMYVLCFMSNIFCPRKRIKKSWHDCNNLHIHPLVYEFEVREFSHFVRFTFHLMNVRVPTSSGNHGKHGK